MWVFHYSASFTASNPRHGVAPLPDGYTEFLYSLLIAAVSYKWPVLWHYFCFQWLSITGFCFVIRNPVFLKRDPACSSIIWMVQPKSTKDPYRHKMLMDPVGQILTKFETSWLRGLYPLTFALAVINANVQRPLSDHPSIDHGLTHWGTVTHIFVSTFSNIYSDNGLSPGRHQAIIWSNVGMFIIGPFSENYVSKFIYFPSRNYLWKCRLRDVDHFVAISEAVYSVTLLAHRSYSYYGYGRFFNPRHAPLIVKYHSCRKHPVYDYKHCCI